MLTFRFNKFELTQQTSRYWPGTGFIPACTACTVYSLTVSGRYRYCTVWYSQFYQYLPILANTKAVSGRYRYRTIWYSQFYQFAGTSRYKNNTALPVLGRYRAGTGTVQFGTVSFTNIDV